MSLHVKVWDTKSLADLLFDMVFISPPEKTDDPLRYQRLSDSERLLEAEMADALERTKILVHDRYIRDAGVGPDAMWRNLHEVSQDYAALFYRRFGDVFELPDEFLLLFREILSASSEARPVGDVLSWMA